MPTAEQEFISQVSQILRAGVVGSGKAGRFNVTDDGDNHEFEVSISDGDHYIILSSADVQKEE